MKKPNILVIYTDQQRWDTIKANGNVLIKTPNIDRLADQGVNFDNCYCQSPVCMPSRISAMTGQYCSALKISKMAITVPQETQTIQKILRVNGYYTALIGKLHYLPHSNRDHKELHPDYDFNHLELSDEPGCYNDAYRSWVKLKAPKELDNISLGLPPATSVWQKTMNFEDNINHIPRYTNKVIPFNSRSDLTHTAFVGEQTLEFLENNSSRPFFCFSGFYSPHEPWIVPKEFSDLYDDVDIKIPYFPEHINQKRNDDYFSDNEIKSSIKGYYAAISEVDSWVGKILNKLDEFGLSDNTIIVFTSDHGEFLGEHLKYGKGFFAPDIISRVPLIIKVPENIGGARQRQFSEIVECIDIVPTLLELCGIQIPPQVQGKVLPVKKSSLDYYGDGLSLTEYFSWKSLRTVQFRYVIDAGGNELLFEVKSDPQGYNNLAGDKNFAEELSKCRKDLLTKIVKNEVTLKHEWVY